MLTGHISGSNLRGVVRIDRSTHAIETIEYEHHEIHAGDSYHVFYADTGVDDDERLVLSFKTPNTSTWIHMVFDVESKGEAEFKLYEDMTITDNTGISIPVYNRNRNSGNTSGVLDTGQNPDLANHVTLNAEMGSGSAYGTVLEHVAFGDAKKAGGEERGISEWILKPDTIYALSFVARAATNIMHLHIEWYEHKDISTG